MLVLSWLCGYRLVEKINSMDDNQNLRLHVDYRHANASGLFQFNNVIKINEKLETKFLADTSCSFRVMYRTKFYELQCKKMIATK